MVRVPFEELRARIERVLLKLGLGQRSALAAQLIAETDRDGVRTHGIARLPRFAEMVRLGRIDPLAEPERIASFGALERWTGHRGPGNLAAHAAMTRAMELARVNGLGAVALADTTHWMRGGSYGWQAAEAGFAAMCWSNTLPNLPPWGATTPAVGNNPLIIAVPRRDAADRSAPIVLDIAMSQFSYGTLSAYRERGELLPFPGGFDEHGELTRDPAAIERTQRALPIGLWKGSGLAFVLDVLAAMLADGRATYEIPADHCRRSGSRRSSLRSHRPRSRRCRSSIESPPAPSTFCTRRLPLSPDASHAIPAKARCASARKACGSASPWMKRHGMRCWVWKRSALAHAHYIFVWPARMSSLKLGLMNFRAVLHLSLEALALLLELRGRRRPVTTTAQREQPLARKRARSLRQLFRRRVQILRIARIGDPHRRPAAEHAAQPVNLAREEVRPLLLRRVVEDEAILFRRVVPRRDRNRLPVARLHQLELALVQRLAHGVVDEALGKRLLQRDNHFGEGARQRGRNLGMQDTLAASLQVDLSVHDECVRARRRRMERPREVTEAEWKSQHREVAVRPRITQPLRRLGEEAVQLRGKLRVSRVKPLTQLQQQAVRGFGGERHRRAGRRMAREISTRFGGSQSQSVGAGQGVQLRSGRGRNAHTSSSNRQKNRLISFYRSLRSCYLCGSSSPRCDAAWNHSAPFCVLASERTTKRVAYRRLARTAGASAPPLPVTERLQESLAHEIPYSSCRLPCHAGCARRACRERRQHCSGAPLTGTVVDTTGAIIPGATVSLETGTSVTSGSDGHFRFPCVADGSHHLQITATSFANQTMTVQVPLHKALNAVCSPRPSRQQ